MVGSPGTQILRTNFRLYSADYYRKQGTCGDKDPPIVCSFCVQIPTNHGIVMCKLSICATDRMEYNPISKCWIMMLNSVVTRNGVHTHPCPSDLFDLLN